MVSGGILLAMHSHANDLDMPVRAMTSRNRFADESERPW